MERSMKIMGDEDIVRDALIKWEDGTYNETKLGMEGLIMTEPLTRSLAIYGLAEISAGEGNDVLSGMARNPICSSIH